MRIRLMTFNIQHGFDHVEKGGIRLDKMADVICRFDPDIIALNEVRSGGEYGNQEKILSELTGMKHHAFAQAICDGHGPYGNALLSKYPIKSALTYPVEDTYYDKLNHYESRVIMKSEILLPGSDDQILSVFISHFGYQSPAEAKNGIKLLKSLTAQVQVPFVFMGDLNNTPDSPALAPLFDMLDDTIKLAGAAAAQKPSFPSDNPKEKIDYIFVSHGLRCVNADIPLDAIASDHLPHIAEIEI